MVPEPKAQEMAGRLRVNCQNARACGVAIAVPASRSSASLVPVLRRTDVDQPARGLFEDDAWTS